MLIINNLVGSIKLIKPDLTIGALTSVNKNTEVNARRNLANKNISIAVDEAER